MESMLSLWHQQYSEPTTTKEKDGPYTFRISSSNPSCPLFSENTFIQYNSFSTSSLSDTISPLLDAGFALDSTFGIHEFFKADYVATKGVFAQ